MNLVLILQCESSQPITASLATQPEHEGDTEMTLKDYKEQVMWAAGLDQKFSITQAEVDALIQAGFLKNQTPGITAWSLMEFAV